MPKLVAGLILGIDDFVFFFIVRVQISLLVIYHIKYNPAAGGIKK